MEQVTNVLCVYCCPSNISFLSFTPCYSLFAWNITFIEMLTVYRWNIQQRGASQMCYMKNLHNFMHSETCMKRTGWPRW